MTSADYLWHVTLTTGHTCKQHRGQMDAIALDRARRLLTEALGGGEPEVVTGYTMRAEARGTSLITTIRAGESLILTSGVATRSRSAPGLWRHLHMSADERLGRLATAGQEPPAAPWIADRIEIGSARALMIAAQTHEWDAVPTWTGAWAALIGWAWIEADQ